MILHSVAACTVGILHVYNNVVETRTWQNTNKEMTDMLKATTTRVEIEEQIG